MAKIKLLLIVFLAVVWCGCQNETEIKHAQNPTSTESDSTSDDDGPPFKHNCLASFRELGQYKINDSLCHVYYSGKGWNKDFPACFWIWSELAYNESAENFNAKYFKLHLLDLETFKIPDNGTEYGNDSIKKYVIAVFDCPPGDSTYSVLYDPNNTGKYPANHIN